MVPDDNPRSDPTITTERRNYLKLLGTWGVLSLAGCSSNDSEDTTAQSDSGSNEDDGTTTESTPDQIGGHLRFGATGEPQNINPMIGIYADKTVMEYMYSRLTQLNEKAEVIPALATNWEHDGQAKAWTFTLREGVIFPNTDGTEMTAKDVKASAEAVLDDDLTPQTGTSHAGDVGEIVIENDYQITIHLNTSDLFYPKRLAENGNIFNILPKSVINNQWEELSTTDFGTGPFNMVERHADDKLVFERNPHYFREDTDGNPLPYLEKFTYKIIPDALARTSALRDTRVDTLSTLDPTQLERLRGSDDIQIQDFTTPSFSMAVLNTKLEATDGSNPFANSDVRKAMKHAMDREEMKAAVDDTVSIAHHDPVPSSMEYYANFPEGLEFGTSAQIDEARAKLDDAGYPDGFEVKKPFIYQVDDDPNFGTFATLFQEQMKEIGITFELQQVTNDTWISEHWNNDESFFYSNWADRLVDPTIHKLSLRSDSEWNSANWTNDKYDKQWDIAMNATDHETFKEAFHEMQRIHHLDGAWLVWGFSKDSAPYRNYVKNVDLRPSLSKKPFWNSWLTGDAPEGPS